MHPDVAVFWNFGSLYQLVYTVVKRLCCVMGFVQGCMLVNVALTT